MFIEQEFLGNTLGGYIWCAGWIFGGFILKRFFANGIINLIAILFKKLLYDIPAKKFREVLGKSLGTFIFIALIYIAFQYIDFPESWNMAGIEEFGVRKALSILYGIIFGIALASVILRIIDCVSIVVSRKYEIKERNAS